MKQAQIEWIGISDQNQGAHRTGSLALGRVLHRPTTGSYHGVPIASNLRAGEGDGSKLCVVVAPARQIAARVLQRVARDDAWATPTLDAELRRGSVKRVDAALATQIVYGSLRTAPQLEAAIGRHLQRPLKVDDWTRAVLISAAYQLLCLERVPPHAVVHDAVELVRMKRGKRLAGFTNAVLRKVAADRPEVPQPPSSLLVPDWLRASLVSSIGSEHTEDLLRVAEESPSIDLRVRADLDRKAVADAIAAAQPDASLTSTVLSPLGLRIRGAGDPRALPGYEQGSFSAQEEGAQLIGLLLGTEPGERVLDACAGRGGKTAQLVEALGESGTVVATDLHEHRLEQIPAELTRLRLDPTKLESATVDWTVGRGGVQGEFDRILVDAPCSGLGTLRRRPEILLRTGPNDPARMGETQRRLLEAVAPLVRPGGTLLYAVCSPLNEEGTEVVRAADLPGFELQVGRPSGLKSLRFESSGRLQLGPWIRGAGPWADAYQVYMWVNVG
ncbi:MAG: transcription antitermination factor NusB [Polyangiales bacterium]